MSSYDLVDLVSICYHSLSIRIVPARVESTPIAPEMFVSITSKMKAVRLVDFKLE